MKMIELVSGLVIGGLAGVALKDKIVGSSSQSDAKQRELDELYSENEKFRKRNKEAERQIEDLFAQIDKLRRDSKNNEDAHDDLEDELNRLRREVSSLRSHNDNLITQLKEYKESCEAQAAQIRLLKERME